MEDIKKQDNKRWARFLQEEETSFIPLLDAGVAITASFIFYLVHGTPYSYFVLILGFILGALHGIHRQLWKLNNKD